MRRRAISAFAVLAFTLVSVSIFSGPPGSVAAAPPIGTTPFYTALDCDLGTPGIQGTCGLVPGPATAEVGVVVFNNSSSPYTIGSLALRVIVRGLNSRLRLASSPSSPSVDLNPDFNQQDLPGAWACTRTWTHGAVGGLFHGDEIIADLTCADANSVGNVIAADSSVTVAVVHYVLNGQPVNPPSADPIQLGFFATDPANGNEKGCNSSAFDPCYGATMNVPGTGLVVKIDCDAAPGVQDGSVAGDCTRDPSQTGTFNVDVVISNFTGVPVTLDSFNYDLYNPNAGSAGTIAPSVPVQDPVNFPFGGASTWGCGSPPAVADTGFGAAGTTTSFLSCVLNAGVSNTIANGVRCGSRASRLPTS